MRRTDVLVFAIACIIGFAVLPSFGGDCPELVVAGSGLSDAVAIAGDTVFFGNNQVFLVGDISDPWRPEVLSELPLDGVFSNIVVADDFAYVLEGWSGRLWIVDVLDPLAPSVLSSHEVAPDSRVIEVSDGHAYVCSASQLEVIDVSDPSDPRTVAAAPIADEPHAIAVHDGWAYIGLGEAGFTVWDVQDPSQPVQEERLLREANDLAIEGSHLFVIGQALAIYDISEPPPHVVPGGYLINGGGCAIHVTAMADRTVAWVLGWGVKLVDVTDPDEPVLLATRDADSDDCGHDLAASGGLSVITKAGLEVIEWDGESIEPRSSFGVFRLSGPATAIHVSGGLATVGTSRESFLLDATDPTNPRFVSSLGGACATAVWGEYAIVWTRVCPFFCFCLDVQILDITDPLAPVEVGVLPESGAIGAGGLMPVGDLLYTLGGWGFPDECRTFLWDISYPSAPILLGELRVHSPWGDTCCKPLAANDSTIYATSPFGSGDNFGLGLYIVDVSDPSAPEQVAWLEEEVGSFVADAATLDEHTLVVCGGDTLYAVDVSDPSSPAVIASLEFPDMWLQAVSVTGNIAYVAAGGGVFVVDLSDPLNPHQIGFHLTPDAVWDLETEGRFVYAATGATGVSVFDGMSCRHAWQLEEQTATQ